MEIGHMTTMQNLTDLPDHVALQGEIDVAVAADQNGFDSLWCVEHHFSDYGLMPDNIQFLTYLAAITTRAKLVPGAVIVPWHDPLRVIEKMSLLEAFAPGRVGLGLGRGLAKREYDAFRQDMNESRERFDEATAMILRGLETGIAENAGKYYHQPRVPIRPRPQRGYSGQDLYSVAMSNDSALAAADIGARMMTFVQGPLEVHAAQINLWRDRFAEKHPNVPVPAPMLTDAVVCHEDADEAARLADQYMSRMYVSIVSHYNFDGDHFENTKGYEGYQAGADDIKAKGLEAKSKEFVASQNWGTPEQIIGRCEERRDAIGDFGVLVESSIGGIPFEVARHTVRLMGEKVIPELKKMTSNRNAM
jgi:alkanesulfonate monooxygenase SsuD/methylene tetrahydromethanopterin reductase-like flavin-dependent oxidoreductase (luciferase family)